MVFNSSSFNSLTKPTSLRLLASNANNCFKFCIVVPLVIYTKTKRALLSLMVVWIALISSTPSFAIKMPFHFRLLSVELQKLVFVRLKRDCWIFFFHKCRHVQLALYCVWIATSVTGWNPINALIVFNSGFRECHYFTSGLKKTGGEVFRMSS